MVVIDFECPWTSIAMYIEASVYQIYDDAPPLLMDKGENHPCDVMIKGVLKGYCIRSSTVKPVLGIYWY